MKAFQSIMIASAFAASVLASPFASAHASLKASDPLAGSTVATAPKQISLTFNEKIEQAFSTVTLNDSTGKAVTTAKAKVDADNPAVLRLETPTLAAGAYTVKWAVAGHDGHRRTGEFSFTVK
jgi:methionine-rich copper-binding protein CopC